jgi:hypothetical protein
MKTIPKPIAGEEMTDPRAFGGPEEPTPEFDEFAKVELFGHQQLIARVTKAPIGDFIRCDILDGKGKTAFTRLVNPKAVYAINLISRSLALALAKQFATEPPVTRYDLPALAAAQEGE